MIASFRIWLEKKEVEVEGDPASWAEPFDRTTYQPQPLKPSKLKGLQGARPDPAARYATPMPQISDLAGQKMTRKAIHKVLQQSKDPVARQFAKDMLTPAPDRPEELVTRTHVRSDDPYASTTSPTLGSGRTGEMQTPSSPTRMTKGTMMDLPQKYGRMPAPPPRPGMSGVSSEDDPNATQVLPRRYDPNATIDLPRQPTPKKP